MVTLALAVVCCGIYPLVVFGVAQLAFPSQANGSLIAGQDGTIHGSRLIGQQFTADKYFISRPSNAGANGLRPDQFRRQQPRPDFAKAARHHCATPCDYRTQNNLDTNTPVPADAVTASASGLDPHISLRNAELQAPRVAKARGFSEDKVRELVRANTDAASLGFLGEPGVNVLELNLALDSLK